MNPATHGMELRGVACARDTDRRAPAHRPSRSLPAPVRSCSCASPSGEQRICGRAIYIRTRLSTAGYRTALHADCGRRIARAPYSHSIVAGGLDEMS